ncbi:hypothetical protein GCM10007897_14910 [Sphingobium jiangsuense]|uniref:Phage repressor protein C with HTH and peptisase S24 domain n=1 Tax=Sphingobium jiangsuense TaxID=870476 RepID=A0A7W6FNT5_9SPHN|nr:S24 family peptidase [Sphingobium jiangsuense]MBB3925065.1 phage repressor protein C with HTH and peptisase S24 domain [Sphingobium jiangsuense]GLT00107.1 hypothetical protein GCM10007897_14910 [Sphingobium jiangsuense]
MSTEQNDRLRAARRSAQFKSAAAAAEAFGWNVSTYRHHENGTRGFGKDHAKAYGRAFGVSAGWLLGLEKNPDMDDSEKMIAHMNKPDELDSDLRDFQDRLFEETGQILVHHYSIKDFDVTFTDLPLFHNANQDFWFKAFSLSLIAEVAKVERDLVCSINAPDSSMAPTIKEGALLLVDTGSKDIDIQDAIWLISLGGTAMIRRLLALPNDRVSVYSDAVGGRSHDLPRDGLLIRGRIVWIGQMQ